MKSSCQDNRNCSDEESTEVDGSGSKREETDQATSGGATSQVTGKKGRITRSLVWEHFTRVEKPKDKCNCNYCGKQLSCATTSGTSNLKTHLDKCEQHLAWFQRQTQSKQHVLSEGDGGNVVLSKVTEAVFRDASNEMLVLAELPLAFIESVAWRKFCSRVKLYKPHSRRTATRDMVEMYVRQKAALKIMLTASKQRVSLTTDIWVAPTTGASYMVTTAHFIDASWKLHKFIIGFKHVLDHKGVTICAVLLECLSDWGIDKIFTITVDNATANTNALAKFKEALQGRGIDALVLNGECMHLRCCARILSLIVKDGLHDMNKNVFVVRNAVTYVRSSGPRRQSFELRVETCKMTKGSLCLDIKTRWNSTYLMLTRVVKWRLAFDRMESEDKLYNEYFEELEKGKKRIGPPLKVNWDVVEIMNRYMALLYSSTLVVSSSIHVNSHKCYSEICEIQRSLMALSNSVDSTLYAKVDAMRNKFDKYWDGMENLNKLVIVDVVFDPRRKMKFASLSFDILYGKDSLKSKMISASLDDFLKRLFEEYKGRVGRATWTATTPLGCTATSQGNVAGFVALDIVPGLEKIEAVFNQIVTDEGIVDTSNEMDRYLKESVENPPIDPLGREWDILSYWKLDSHKFPVLSEIAKDVLVMHVSSVASESSFSISGRIVTPQRSCLTHYMIEVLMCTEQWMKSDHHLGEKGVENFTQMIADIEEQDKLEKEFEIERESD